MAQRNTVCNAPCFTPFQAWHKRSHTWLERHSLVQHLHHFPTVSEYCRSDYIVASPDYGGHFADPLQTLSKHAAYIDSLSAPYQYLDRHSALPWCRKSRTFLKCGKHGYQDRVEGLANRPCTHIGRPACWYPQMQPLLLQHPALSDTRTDQIQFRLVQSD